MTGDWHGDGAIDVHTHIVPDRLPAYIGRHLDIPWPSVERKDACHAQVMISGRVYRAIDDACWDVERRCGGMDGMGVRHQVLSPMPELLSYWLPVEDAASLAAYLNEFIAGMVAAAPDRFAGLGTVTLQDPEAAARQLGSVIKELGLSGVEIGSNVLGRPIGDPVFEPFFAEAEALGAAIFVHALKPVGLDRLIGPPMLEQVVAFPSETALSVASVICGGLLSRHPRLRIAFSHGGGGFGLTLSRLQHAWSVVPEVRRQVPEAPRQAAGRLFYDSLVYDRATLAFLVDSFGASQVLLGTDYPFKIMEPHPVAAIEALGLAPLQRQALLRGNARRFLGKATG